jgi:hypothetical protein
MYTSNHLFNDKTKYVCNCIFIVVFLILVFVISPLNKFTNISIAVRVIVLFILGYSIYLNLQQTQIMNNITKENNLSSNFNSHLSLNIIGGYVFSFFILVLLFFIINSFF